jgi:hypothetical protein
MDYLKKWLKLRIPVFYRYIRNNYYFVLRLFTGKSQAQLIFNKIYSGNNWSDPDSVSGPGSNLKNTENLRRELPSLIEDLKIKTFLDIPCGDYFWMKEINLDVEYTGADIVEDLVIRNNKLFGNDYKKFVVLDITKDKLPKVDVIFCRDCFPHLHLKSIKASLKNIKESGARYLLASTYTSCFMNDEIYLGGFRPLNMQLKPFNFPPPVRLIKDLCITEKAVLEDKNIGVWKIADLPL